MCTSLASRASGSSLRCNCSGKSTTQSPIGYWIKVRRITASLIESGVGKRLTSVRKSLLIFFRVSVVLEVHFNTRAALLCLPKNSFTRWSTSRGLVSAAASVAFV
eukprot:Lithocolla_globosa_v1_NODE_4000_length_1532_cov_11.610697.p3 type:complete len:105 gc:universal NODE_4000_length_1532_cov_11.610697:360-46(-)